MSSCWREQDDWTRNQDVEGQVRICNTDPLGSLIRTCNINPQGRCLQIWNVIFEVSCVIAITVDPLFFYLPVINEDNKCLALDTRLKIIAICLRSVTDLIYVANIFLQFLCPYVDEEYRRLRLTKLVSDSKVIAERYLKSCYFVVDFLAILPIPQVIVPTIFSEMGSKKYLHNRKLLNAIVLVQYVPRFTRIYLSLRKRNENASVLTKILWVKAAFNLFLYIIASHVLGAFWYFFSVQRETACWHKACENHISCTRSSFKCHHILGDTTFLNDHCPTKTPNATIFDFGIFVEALQSGTVASTDFPQKFLHCFWWGLRNLSSLGQSLETSTYFWENCFTVFISIFGLLLFLYFIGNLQLYMQVDTSKELASEKSEEMKLKMRVKEREIDLWLSRTELPDMTKREIMYNVRGILEEEKDINLKNMFPHLSLNLKSEIKRHLCLPILRTVPILEQKTSKLLMQWLCDALKPMHYNEHSYIVREGDPLDAIIFITQGIVWKSTTSNGDQGSPQCMEKGHFFGEELLEWGFVNLPPRDLSGLPISTRTLKTHSKVEAFSLTAIDLKTLVSRHSRVVSAAKGLLQATLHRRRRQENEENSCQMDKWNKCLLPCTCCFKTS